ncbi:low affinity iron permease family protein [Ralstonia pickettii]|uniref:low affinity iron permease family protein n=1 Tax=Ralstonia pickettii TaxID=329 RepID=UPI002714BAD9|nr:low affinity iron permease family protein [Ralstonia pickettii]WKZ86476.1 low affinity iron permease family protein [Ralstonia pickettii]
MKTPEPGPRSGKLDTVPDTDTTTYARSGRITRLFDAFASAVTRWAGSPYAFGGAVLAILLWTVTGPLFDYSDRWQLVINTGTTIVTFLMVFVIQQSQNKDSIALHLKLNELLASHRSADNRLIGIEEATEDDLRRLAAAYLRIAQLAEAEAGPAGVQDSATDPTHPPHTEP